MVDRWAGILARRLHALLVALLAGVFLLTLAGPLLFEAAPRWSQAVTLLFGLSCHQIPDRCLRIGPGLAPVCARCQAIYAGLALAGLASLGRLRPLPLRWLLLASIPIAADALSQIGGLRTSTATMRVVTGLPWGLAIGSFALPWLRDAMRDATGDSARFHGQPFAGSAESKSTSHG